MQHGWGDAGTEIAQPPCLDAELEIWGIDHSPAMLQVAKRKTGALFLSHAPAQCSDRNPAAEPTQESEPAGAAGPADVAEPFDGEEPAEAAKPTEVAECGGSEAPTAAASQSPRMAVKWREADVAAFDIPQLRGRCNLIVLSAGSFHHLLTRAYQASTGLYPLPAPSGILSARSVRMLRVFPGFRVMYPVQAQCRSSLLFLLLFVTFKTF